jgi:acetyl-CoA acetyltransferase
VGPFRRPDFCLSSEGATCLIVTTRERGEALAKPPVRIAGIEGLRASRDESVLFGRPGLGVGVGREFPLIDAATSAVYDRAGVQRRDVDGLYVYDSFSSNVWMVLEGFGFCSEGEAGSYVRQAGIGMRSALPVNSNGGLLSEAHLLGIGHLIEMVRQLRGQAGARQIPDAQVLQWATPIGDSIILSAA